MGIVEIFGDGPEVMGMFIIVGFVLLALFSIGTDQRPRESRWADEE